MSQQDVETNWRALATAVENGDMEALRQLVSDGIDVNSTKAGEWTPLACASGHGKLEAMIFLLDNGANINLANKYGHTALHIACYMNRMSTFGPLLKRGANPWQKDHKGRVPLDRCNDNTRPQALGIILSMFAEFQQQQVAWVAACHDRDRLVRELEETKEELRKTRAVSPFHRYRPYSLILELLPPGCGAGVHPVETVSPLFNFCRTLCLTGGAYRDGRTAGVANYHLIGVDAIVHTEVALTIFTGIRDKVNRLRLDGGNHFNFATRTFSAEKLQVLSLLRDQFHERQPGPNMLVNTVYCYHGTRCEDVASICANGIVATRATDAGFFGSGCYSTLNIEYAARYAYGEFDNPTAPPRHSPDGRYPVIMLAAAVGMAYPISPDVDYGNEPGIPPGYSDYFGRPLKKYFDSHVACVNQASGFQAVNQDRSEYVELVIDQQAQMLPLAVLWFARN